ncbi:MAG: vitamin B12 dependent-methionine synthase activation domain-containing protein [Nocardioidaceae bacterium]
MEVVPCLADFFRPKDAGELDVVGFHLVTMGAHDRRRHLGPFRAQCLPRLPGAARAVRAADRATPSTEYWHARVRRELDIDGTDPAGLLGILKQGYRGERYSFGYPACPDLDDRATLMRLLRPERIGVELSEELQLHPEQSTDAMILHHPEAGYFNAR